MSQLTLLLLGVFSLRTSQGIEISMTSKKARVLLAYLASRPGFRASRLDTALLLWEFHDEKQALTNLRQTLAVLNHQFGSHSPHWLIRDSGFISLNKDFITVDISEVKNLDGIKDKSLCERAIDLFKGQFLEGLSFHEPGLNDWLNQQRQNFDNYQVKIRKQLLEFQIALEVYPSAANNAERLVTLDPVDEENHRSLMAIYAKLGQQHRILRQYQQCCHALEFHQIEAPQTETVSLFQSLYYKTEIKPVFEAIPESRLSAAMPSAELDKIPAIAVLPFQDLVAKSESYGLSQALTGEIVSELRRFHGFKVISALSSLSLKGQNCDLKTASRLLGARYLVSGSIQQSDMKVQISVELVDAENGELIWADRYLRQIEELFVLQAELARDIAGAIEPEAVGHAYLTSTRKPAESMSAWDLVLRGDHSLFKQIGTRWNSDEAQNLYRKAIDIDPDYAPSYSGLAYSLCLELKEDIARDSKQVADQMLDMAQHAANLDNNNPWCLVVLARAQQQLRDYDAAVFNYRKAVELCPSSSKAHFGLSFGLSATGQYDEAIAASDRAIELSPRDPMSWSYHVVKSLSYIYSGQFDQAAATTEMAMNYPSANHWAPAILAPSLVHLGRYDDALKVLESAKRIKPDITVHTVESAFATKKESDSLAIREGLIEAGLKGY